MRPQNLGTACVVSQNKTISAFLTKGFLCKRQLGERKSYLSYSQKLSDRHFPAWHKPCWATQYSPGMESPKNFQRVNKVDCYVPRASRNAIVQACHMSPKKVSYLRTFGMPGQGQMLDMWESQTTESALRDDWLRIVPRHTLEVVLEVILEHMCTG